MKQMATPESLLTAFSLSPLCRFAETPFDGNVANWNTENVESMQAMFFECRNFTGQGISTWRTDRVTDFSYMFYGNWKMSAQLSDWNTESATSMRSMFNEATSFPGGVTNWKVDRVIDFGEMYVSRSVSFLSVIGPLPVVSRTFSLHYPFSFTQV